MKSKTSLARKTARRLLKRLIPQILVQYAAIAVTAIASNMLLTWVFVELLEVRHIYLSATFETLGTLLLMSISLVATNTYVYRKRLREINTLSEAISRVVSGDYQSRIPIAPHDPMAEIYEDFNKMVAELSSVQILRNDFINNYSHEFKTPIASINGFAELLMEKKLSPEEQRQYLEIIRDESQRLSSLAKNTILLSKLSNQFIITDTERYNLGEQLRQCAIICSRQWLDKRQDFTGDFPDVMYVGNRELMQHLWLNLLGNAIKFTPEGGEIIVTLATEGENAVITVSDSGEGMDAQTLKHLFTPYFQGDSSRSRQGLGLGLSIVKRILELNDGQINVFSELGVGSRFIVTLPLRGKGRVN